MVYQKRSYDTGSEEKQKRPLMIGCSGGGGHIAAIQGIAGYLKSIYGEKIVLNTYQPVLYSANTFSPTKNKINIGIFFTHDFIISKLIRGAISQTRFPILPDKSSIESEVRALSDKEKRNGQRDYIDMLLDVYPAGYESAAIWNVLQKNDKISELKKLINLQYKSDAENYRIVREYYITALKKAAQDGIPYTEIISTQAMSLPALCGAVKAYNGWLENEGRTDPKVLIHQYLTDLPTKGAVHFFNALSTLNEEQQKQMKLYGVGMDEKIITHFFPRGSNFNAIYDIPANENPMVRPGFNDLGLNNSSNFDKTVSIQLKEENAIEIKAYEQIGSIMLGSQAGMDTVKYIETMLKNGIHKVFVFGGKTPAIAEKLKDICQRFPGYKDNIIPLANQGDKEIAPLLSRSNVVVIRGGGLSVMEQLAMEHNPEQSVLIHHANSKKSELTSGISWEDENVKILMKDLSQKKVHTEKTSPLQAKRQIAEALLIAAVKRSHYDIEQMTYIIKKLPKSSLNQYVDELNTYNINFVPQVLVKKFESFEKRAQDYVDAFNEILNLGKEYLDSKIMNDVFEQGIDSSMTIDEVIIYADSRPQSTYFSNLVQNYKAINKLQGILNDNNHSSATRLSRFNSEYDKPEIRNALYNDNFIKLLFKKIEKFLRTIFGASKSYSHPDELKKQINDLRHNNKDIVQHDENVNHKIW